MGVTENWNRNFGEKPDIKISVYPGSSASMLENSTSAPPLSKQKQKHLLDVFCPDEKVVPVTPEGKMREPDCLQVLADEGDADDPTKELAEQDHRAHRETDELERHGLRDSIWPWI